MEHEIVSIDKIHLFTHRIRGYPEREGSHGDGESQLAALAGPTWCLVLGAQLCPCPLVSPCSGGPQRSRGARDRQLRLVHPGGAARAPVPDRAAAQQEDDPGQHRRGSGGQHHASVRHRPALLPGRDSAATAAVTAGATPGCSRLP